MERYECKMTVGLLLKKDNEVLLMKRKNTGFEDGMYELVVGHVEKNESLKMAIVRETKEEIGIDINQNDLKFLTIHYRNSGENYINFFFVCDKYKGKLKNCEPDKCDEIKWFNMNNLPENLGGMARREIDAYEKGSILVEYGWENS